MSTVDPDPGDARRAGRIRHADHLQRARACWCRRRARRATRRGRRIAAFRRMRPIVGFARTARIRARHAPPEPAGETPCVAPRLLPLHRRRAASPRSSSSRISTVRDAGYGAFWGEVQSAIHVGLGALGLVTNGSVRDIDQWAPGFQFLAGSIGAVARLRARRRVRRRDRRARHAGSVRATSSTPTGTAPSSCPPRRCSDCPRRTAGRRARGAHPGRGPRAGLHRRTTDRSIFPARCDPLGTMPSGMISSLRSRR